MRVAVVGTGYVGLTTGACLADMGNEVVCHDRDAARISALWHGTVPFFEPGLAELVGKNTRDGRLTFTTEIGAAVRGAELCFIAVGTPTLPDGAADARDVLAAIDAVADALTAATCVVIKSTVPPGTGDAVADRIAARLGARGATQSASVASNPEFLREGKAVEDFLRPDRIVVGAADEPTRGLLRRLYEPFVRNGHPLLVMDRRSAEMSKYAANAMLATRIALVNELANLCEACGADIEAVRRAVGADPRIGAAYLYPGVGFGGSCLPKDLRALIQVAAAHGESVEILAAVEAQNRAQRRRLLERVQQHLGTGITGARLAVWGLAFKPMTDDVRESPALDLIPALLAAGATVRAFDPEAMANARRALGDLPGLTWSESAFAAALDADAIILLTEWGQLRGLDLERLRRTLRRPLIFDGRNQYDPVRMGELGFTYVCVGRPRP